MARVGAVLLPSVGTKWYKIHVADEAKDGMFAVKLSLRLGKRAPQPAWPLTQRSRALSLFRAWYLHALSGNSADESREAGRGAACLCVHIWPLGDHMNEQNS